MNRHIATNGRPPAGRPYIPILSPGAGRPPIEAVVLSHQLYGCFTHYVQMRTRPCAEVEFTEAGRTVLQPCLECQQGYPRRWKGYLAVQLARVGRVVLLELTRSAVEACPRLWPDQLPVRGVRVRVSRTGRRVNGRVVVTVEDCLAPNDPQLPPGPDVEQALIRVWFGGN